MRRSLALLLTLAAPAALLACGDDDDGGGGSAADEKAVRAAVSAFAADGPTPCAKLVTKELIEKVNGPGAQCEDPSAKPGSAKGASIADIRIDGDEATAVLSQRTSGVQLKGEVELEKQGSAWRVDELGRDFLRSLMVGVLPQGFAQADSAELKPITTKPSLQQCLADAYDDLPEGQLEDIGYAALGNRDDTPAKDRFNTLLIGCILDDADGVKAMRKLTEQGIRESASGGTGDCVVGKLRTTVTDAQVAAALRARTEGTERTSKEATALRAAAAAAEKECG